MWLTLANLALYGDIWYVHFTSLNDLWPNIDSGRMDILQLNIGERNFVIAIVVNKLTDRLIMTRDRGSKGWVFAVSVLRIYTLYKTTKVSTSPQSIRRVQERKKTPRWTGSGDTFGDSCEGWGKDGKCSRCWQSSSISETGPGRMNGRRLSNLKSWPEAGY